jgi:hypothetical protein
MMLRLCISDSTDRELFARPLREADWADVSSRTAHFRIHRSGLNVEFRIEVFRFLAGELRFTGLAYRKI